MKQNYVERTSDDILNAAKRFDTYHTLFRIYVDTHKGAIKSSLDRGTVWYPKDILTDDILELLGSKRTPRSYSYGPEEGDEKLRGIVAGVENARYGTSYTSKEVAIMPGAWAGLEFAIQEILNLKGGKTEGKVAIIGPTLYQMFYAPIKSLGIEMKAFDFVMPGSSHIPESMDDMERVFEYKPKIIVVTNPNNPDGLYFKPDLLRDVIERAKKEGTYIIIDEIQNCFTRSDINGLGYGNWIQATNVVRVDSPSKRYALADCRVGWMIAHSDILHGKYNKIDDLEGWAKQKISDWLGGNIEDKLPTRLEGAVGRMSNNIGNAPRVANTILAYLLSEEQKKITEHTDFFNEPQRRMMEKMEYIVERLQNMPRVAEILIPESCVNVTAQFNYKCSDMQLSAKLMEEGTLIMPASGYGYRPEDSVLRITFAEKPDKLKHSMDTLKKVLSQ